MVRRVHNTYSRAMDVFRAHSFLHLVHWLPSWIPVWKQWRVPLFNTLCCMWRQKAYEGHVGRVWCWIETPHVQEDHIWTNSSGDYIKESSRSLRASAVKGQGTQKQPPPLICLHSATCLFSWTQSSLNQMPPFQFMSLSMCTWLPLEWR